MFVFGNFVQFNPLTPGAFAKNALFGHFGGFVTGSQPRSKMHLPHDSSLSFLPLASRFMTFWLGRAQKSKLGFSIFEFSSPFLFLLFFSFCCTD